MFIEFRISGQKYKKERQTGGNTNQGDLKQFTINNGCHRPASPTLAFDGTVQMSQHRTNSRQLSEQCDFCHGPWSY